MKIKLETDPEVKSAFSEKVNAALDWIDKHKWLISAALTTTTVVLYFKSKKVARVTVKEQNYYKDTRIYDPSLGHYWELRRKLSNREWLDVESRVKSGEKYGEVLASLGVLK